MRLETVKEQRSPVGANQKIVRTEDGRYFCVSGVHALYTGWEVLVFACDADGEVTDWLEVAGGRGITHEQAMAELSSLLDDNCWDDNG